MFGLTLIQTLVAAILIVLIAVLIGYIVYLVINKKWSELRVIAYRGILEAQRMFKFDPGSKKFKYVLDILWAEISNKFPLSLITIFITQEDVADQLQYWYEDIMDFLDDGNVNGSIQHTVESIVGTPLVPRNTQSTIIIKPIAVNNSINIKQPSQTSIDSNDINRQDEQNTPQGER